MTDTPIIDAAIKAAYPPPLMHELYDENGEPE